MEQWISGVVSVLATTFVWLIGGVDVAFICLIVAIALDYISGLIKAYNTKTLSSSIGFRGILKKIGILILVMLSVIVDRITVNNGGIRTLVVYYFVANEGLSILENLAQAGLPIPKKLKEALRVIKKENK
jgi:toxin secretion/phage lysis holin